MFVGQYYHNLDEKSRLTIPATFRELFAEGGGAHLLRGFDQNLLLLTNNSFTAISDRILKLSITDPNARELRRLIFASAANVEFDRAGRILIPQFLLEKAEIKNEAVVVGTGGYVEIWSPRLWALKEEQLSNSESTAARFAALDLPTI